MGFKNYTETAVSVVSVLQAPLLITLNFKATATNNEPIIEEDNGEKVVAKKQKKSKKSKEKKHHKKRKSIDKERDELEEFLNGIPPTNIQTDVGAYEEL